LKASIKTFSGIFSAETPCFSAAPQRDGIKNVFFSKEKYRGGLNCEKITTFATKVYLIILLQYLFYFSLAKGDQGLGFNFGLI